MRLVNTSTLLQPDFSAKAVPRYAILSHRWEDAGVTFQDIRIGQGPEKAGWRKIAGCCSQAARDGWEYVVRSTVLSPIDMIEMFTSSHVSHRAQERLAILAKKSSISSA